MLIRRDITNGLSSAQAGWLEGDLYELFDAAERAHLHNSVKPGDDTVPSYELRILETFRDPINKVLRLLGYDTSTEDDTANVTPARRRTIRFHGIALRQIFDAGLVTTGERLISTNGSWPASAVVTNDGGIDYDGHRYDTPSGAAMAVKNGPANGWDFWAVERPDGSERLSTLRSLFAAREPDHVERPPKGSRIAGE
jgi:Restriction Enzyme Adenine Methylase Associated